MRLFNQHVITQDSYSSLLYCVFPAGPRLFSIILGKRTLAFTHVLLPTLMVLHPATPSLRKVTETETSQGINVIRCFQFFDLFLLCVRVKEAAGDQSRSQISQWVFEHLVSALLFLSTSRTWLILWAVALSPCFLFNPVIPLKSELAVELLEKGKVRFWLQSDQMSANGKVDYVFNDNALSHGEVRE